MKYLDDPKLSALTQWLNEKELGDRVLKGRVEAFSCKKAGDDKKLSKTLEASMKELGESPASYGSSPNFGRLSDASVRRILIDLICTMNASFPDYDFSSVTPEHFAQERSVESVMRGVQVRLGEISELHQANFLQELWSSVGEVINLKECQVYSYKPDMDSDPFSGCLWSFNFLFLNKALKRIVYFHCRCMARNHFLHGEPSSSTEDDEDMFQLDS
ncbi:unnamed protein product [Chrysoparadoxa australica]